MERVCRDRIFTSRRHVATDLRELCERTPQPTADGRKEVLGPNPADRVHDLIVALNEYFDAHEGEQDRLVVQQAEGRRGRADLYRVGLIPNIITQAATRLFWKPYERSRVLIGYSKPMFVADLKHQIFVREVKINTEEDLKKARPESLVRALPKPSKPQYTFVTAGEVEALFRLTRFFAPPPWSLEIEINGFERGDRLRSPAATAWRGLDAIIVGTPRANGFLVEYQELYGDQEFEFVLENDGIHDRTGRLVHKDRDGEHETIAFAIFTRLKGVKDEHSTVSLIVSNNGRAIQRVTEVLTTEGELGTVLNGLPPEQFQIVFAVKVIGQGAEPGPWRAIAKWPERAEEIVLSSDPLPGMPPRPPARVSRSNRKTP